MSDSQRRDCVAANGSEVRPGGRVRRRGLDVYGGHTAREVVLHVLTETAVHAGHLDAARELIDGRTWLVLS